MKKNYNPLAKRRFLKYYIMVLFFGCLLLTSSCELCCHTPHSSLKNHKNIVENNGTDEKILETSLESNEPANDIQL